ncbi:MAG: alpha-hydroxy-acid oxidizing protein [Gemmatimonadetes bacterium]|nr:alpha-hydroxy-acid oxidizing protein [Gemmatimonadota bacterium]
MESDRYRNIDDYEAAARERMPRPYYDYYAGGAEDEVTLLRNREAYQRISLRPRVLIDVTGVNTAVELLGVKQPHPILLAPAAFQKLAHPEGELASARAARATDTVFVASTMANTSIEAIGAERCPLWFQLYVFRDRGITQALVQRAEEAGARALCLTATVPIQGLRERDIRNRFHLPPTLEVANLHGLIQARMREALGSGLHAWIDQEFDPALDWAAVDWLRSITRLPVLVKGLLTPEDARLAVRHGARGIIVSNHGGRQLDTAEPTIEALPDVVDAADDVPVLIDGGIRRGSDIVKAIALGARAVLIGRPYLWGLAVGGQAGVEDVIRQLVTGVERTLQLMGRTSLAQLDRDAVRVGR